MSHVKEQKEVVRLLKKGAKIILDFQKNAATFRVVGGILVRRFSLALLKEMKEKEIVVLQKIVGLHSIYKLNTKNS